MRRRPRKSPLAAARTLVAAGIAALAAAPAEAREVAFPLELDHAFVRQRIIADLFDGPNESTQVSRDASGCSEIVLSHPKVSGRDGLLRLAADFDAKVGVGFGDWCWSVTHTGRLDAGLEARLHPRLPIVEFRVVSSDLYDDRGVQRFTGSVWDWVRSQVHPQLETLRVDLNRPLAELKAFAPALFPGDDQDRVRMLMDSLSLADVAIGAEAIAVRVRIEVPPAAAPAEPAPQPEAPLTEEELARWQAAWQSWDGFLTFVVKHGSREGGDALRKELGDVLLQARYDIASILESGAPRDADPVRPLFLRTWERLAPVLRQLTTRLPGEAALHYMSLIAAADLVQAIDQLGPGYGVELSTDGLRRMARMLEPAPSLDPTAYSESVDPELRSLFDFGPPLALPAPEAEPAPEPPAPPLPAEPPAPEPVEPPGAFLDPTRLTIVLAGAPAPQRSVERWIPTLDEVGEYLPVVREMLSAAATRTQKSKQLPERYEKLFRHLVLTTAWQESCWRQFVNRGGKRQPLTSPVGAVGIMQVNVRVWRGFYDVTSLRDSPQYNAEAGSEILHHYLMDYAIARKEESVRNQLDDLARATYAAYNAGPRQLLRYRRARGGKGHPIDAHFWTKYQQIQKGNELAVRSCFPGLAA